MIKTLIYSGNSITLIFDTEDFYMNFCTREQAEHLTNNRDMSLEEVRTFLEPSYKKKVEQNNQALRIVEKVTSDSRYYFKEGALYRVGIPLSIPKDFAESIYDVVMSKALAEQDLDDVNAGYWDDQLERLDNLWKWTALIRTPQSRESFYSYVAANNLIVTKQGFVIGFRRANRVNTYSALRDLVINNYEFLRKRKKSTNVPVYHCKYNKSYQVGGDPNDLTEPEFVGYVKDLYHSLNAQEEVFESVTSSRFNNKKLQFRIGQETRIPENEVDWNPDIECSFGIHGHSGRYEDSGYGDTRFAFVMNPKDIAACPYQDHKKFRMCALTPLQVLEKTETFILTEEHEKIIEKLFENHISELEQKLQNSDFEEFKHHSLIQDLDAFKSIFNTVVTENKEIVKQRLIKL